MAAPWADPLWTPAWAERTHDGFVARFSAGRRERGGCCFIWVLAGVWALIVVAACAGGQLGLDLASVCVVSMMPFLAALAVGMAMSATDQHEVRLTTSQVAIRRRRWGRTRQWALLLVDLDVSTNVYVAGKGYSTCHLHLRAPDGTHHAVPLPGGRVHRDVPRVEAEAAWIERMIRQAAARAPQPGRPGPDAESLERLRRRPDAPSS